jgi:hypothetical protein
MPKTRASSHPVLSTHSSHFEGLKRPSTTRAATPPSSTMTVGSTAAETSAETLSVVVTCPDYAADSHPFCALPAHFFDRSRAGEDGRGASLSVQSWAATPKSR